jgi:hypothetical protein
VRPEIESVAGAELADERVVRHARRIGVRKGRPPVDSEVLVKFPTMTALPPASKATPFA